MEDHLRYTCPARVELCEFCRAEFPALDEHSCPKEPLYCENKCGLRIQRRHMARHKSQECTKRLVQCRYISSFISFGKMFKGIGCYAKE
jgi:TNF receptor-associated factor 4